MTGKLNGRHLLFIALSFATYFVYAVYFNTFGTDASVMMDYFNITEAQQGLIITAQSIGCISTAIFIALMGERHNKINIIALGLLIFSAACLLIGAIPAFGDRVGVGPAYNLILLLTLTAGVGYTLMDILMNSVITDVYPTRKKTLQPIVHAFYGSGSMLAPLFVTAVVNPGLPRTFSMPFLITGFAAVAVFILYTITGKSILKDTPYFDKAKLMRRKNENPAEVFKTKTSWLFMAAGILYFTFQIGIASWLPTYSMQQVGVSFETSGMMSTAFFGGALVMRFLGPLFLRKMSPRAVFNVFGIISGVLMLAAVFTEDLTAMITLVALSGFMQGSSVVTFIMICCETFPHRTASASSIYALAAAAASMTAPWWMGEIAGRMGFQVPMVMICVCMLASVLLIFLQGRGEPAREPGETACDGETVA